MIKNKIIFVCDQCGDELDTDETEFNDAFELFKSEGWKGSKEGQKWKHFCPVCR